MNIKEFLKDVELFNNYVDTKNCSEAVLCLNHIIEKHGNLKPLHLSKFLSNLYSNWPAFTPEQQDNILELLEPSMKTVFALKTVLGACQQDINFCAKVIQKIIQHNIASVAKEFFHYIIGNEILIRALQYSLQQEYLISQQLPKELLRNLVYYAINYNDFRFLEFIEKIDQNQFNEIKLSLPKEEQDKLNKILSRKSSLLSQYTREFVEGFGNVSYEGGLLTCAQIAENKKSSYNFNPIILKEVKEFEEFISFIAKNIDYFKNKSLKFAISGSHWISGMIEFDQEGKMRILLMDSMGHEIHEDKEPCIVNIGYETSEVIKIIKNNIKSDIKIYCPSEKRQNSMKGCSIFALDDLRRFYTIQENLPKKYSSLFDFYEQNGTEKQGKLFLDEESELVTLLDCKLPAHFQKTTQSSKLIKATENNEEFKQLPNRHGKTPLDSIASSFEEIAGRKVNKKLDSKLEKHAVRNVRFLHDHSDQDTKKMMKAFSFEGFKEKVQYEKDVSLNTVSSTSSANVAVRKGASRILTTGNATIINMSHRSKRR